MLGGQILDLDVFRIHDKTWEEGEAAGRLEMLFDLVSQGQLTETAASSAIKMPIADFKQRMGEYNRAHS